MRLAQAARKLGITTEDIVSFLAKKEVTIIKDSNTKLEQSSVDLLYNYFGQPEEDMEPTAPAPIIEAAIVEAESLLEEKVIAEEKELKSEEEVIEDGSAAEETDEEQAQEIQNEEQPIATSADSLDSSLMMDEPQEQIIPRTGRKYKTVSDLLAEQAQSENDESSEEVIIKAEKVNLKGLQVLGKIELPEQPEKPKKEDKDKEDKSIGKTRGKRFDKHKNATRGPKNRRELSPLEIREREQRKAKKKRLAEEAEKKKQKEAYYTETILKPKQKAQKKTQAKKKNTNKEITKQSKPAPPKPKTVLGKFWRWLNT